jgi:FtsP/CotA-like multicopper oxidase with cupredoxin domain
MLLTRRAMLVATACSALLAMSGVAGSSASGAAAPRRAGDRPAEASPTFAEPVRLSSTDGVLEVNLLAHQGTTPSDTADSPVRNHLVFGYELLRGRASDGERAGDDRSPGPTLHVAPGERLIVHLVNELEGLTIEDFLDPAFTPEGEAVPRSPRQLTSAPLNLHTHGLHVSPDGNSDNVLLDLPAGFTNTYTYDIPADMPEGLYWYHSHRHTLTAAQTSAGLAGLLEIGRADGNLPLVTEHGLPIRDLAIQYDYVFDRRGGLAQLNNVNWPQYVSTLRTPKRTQLADGTYVPKLTPVNFSQSKHGTTFFTNWYTGPLSVDNNRGKFQFLPSNLQHFSSAPGQPSVDVPADPTAPDRERDLQFTVNGQFQPTVETKPGQTEIWVLANISDFAYVNVTLTETATGRHPPIAIVGQDGNPYPEVHLPTTGDGTTLLIPPASRFAIAVTMPASGDLVLEMPPLAGSTQTLSNEGILYTNDGTDHPPAVLGTVSVDPSAVSYVDGFFTFPTQVLARATAAPGVGVSVPFTDGQPLGASTSFVDTAGIEPAVERELLISGGFDNANASKEDPKAFVYEFDGNAFPYVPLIQPRLGSIEQWSIINSNNDEHPIHIHVNDFQVAEIVDPTAGTTTGFQPWGQDNANVPAPAMDAGGNVTAPGVLRLRTKFQQFTGTYVIHCHRLNHEDNGLMAIVNVIPAVSTYAVGSAGTGDSPAAVRVYDGADDHLVTTLAPFPERDAEPSVAMGDVDGDQVLDLIVGAGEGGPPEVVAYSGAAALGEVPFQKELTRFPAFAPDFRGGVRVAAADIDGNALADNLVVASGPGMDAEVKVFGSRLPRALGIAPAVFATFSPYPGVRSGVTIATGMVDAVSGRSSIVTAPGPGSPARVKTFRFDLYTPNPSRGASAVQGRTHGASQGEPITTSSFLAFDPSYRGGVSLATGWVAGAEGGAQRIITGQLAGSGVVKVFSSGSALDGEPTMYLESPDAHSMEVAFAEMARLDLFPGSASRGVRVATTSTLDGADLLVSGVRADGTTAVTRYAMVRSAPAARTAAATLERVIESSPNGRVASLGGS